MWPSGHPVTLSTMTTTHTAPAITAVPPASRYRIDPTRSAVLFTTRHLFGLGRVRGRFELRDGEIRIADPVSDSTARATVATASFDTGNTARDAAVLSPRLLDPETHPVLVFTSTNLDQEGCVLHGELMARGNSAPLDLQIDDVTSSGAALRVRAHARVDRYGFGITKAKGLAARYVEVRLDIVANQA